MSTGIELQPAMVLHTRPFRNTSLLVDLLTRDAGRLRAVARGARRAGSRQRALLQLFQPVLATLRGRGEVLTLAGVEQEAAAIPLHGDRLFSGLYVNEILIRLLPLHQPVPDLFARYRQTLLAVAGQASVEPPLRYFELDLLEEAGYAPDLWHEADGGQVIRSGRRYLLRAAGGFEAVPAGNGPGRLYDGNVLVALRERNLESEPPARAPAKRLLRELLAPHLGDRPLQSRQYLARLSPGSSGG